MFRNLLITALAIGPALSGVIKNEKQLCSFDEFQCDDMCISVSRLCDGVNDCYDGFDESVCLPGGNSSLVLGDAVNRGKRQSGCRRNEWQCRDGKCIEFYGKCDGIVDCSDGSDETHPLCRHSVCQDNLFRCTYGACVDGTAPCNGVQECADNSDELLPKCLNESRVVRGQFRCDDGQQISVTELCDGELNCADGSDENIKACAGKSCPSFLFQCAYGACVDKGSDCNGKQECADGSDESDELCNRTSTISVKPTITTTTAASPGACTLPPYPANGRYEVNGRPFSQPGQQFSNVLSITVTCDTGYEVDGKADNLLPCFKNEALSSYIAKCKRYCVLTPHHSVVYECVTKNENSTLTRQCSSKEFVGTIVMPRCRTPNYRGSPAYMHCTESGWTNIAKCESECGRTTPDGQEYIINGTRARHGEIPWHAGIYDKTYKPYMQVCGGSLVSTKAVITAAHCFWIDGLGAQSARFYNVAIGKIYRPWNDSHDTYAQFSEITDIHIPAQFRGAEANFQHDIAIVILQKEIEYKTYIRPVCVSFDTELSKKQLIPANLGKIAGWGFTSAKGKPGQVLQVVELPYVSYDQCFLESPSDFREYLTGDKICAGFRNGTALCQGDSGGGLTFPAEELGVQRYYLRGIVSTAPRNKDKCDPFQRTAFTKFTDHEHFIKSFYIEGL